MDDLINMEQPDTLSNNATNVSEQNTQEDKCECREDNVIGSNQFGKFKDATTLYDAYNNLQKEFTRKSQQLSSILKNNNIDKNTKNLSKNNQNDINFNQNDNQNAVFDLNNIQDDLPEYKKSDWTSKAISFLNSKEDAKQYSSEIAKLLMEDKALAKSPDCLEYAYAIVKSKTYKEPASFIKDQNFLDEYIFNNDEIKDKIIEEYLTSITKNKNTNVKVITGLADNVSLTRPADKPKNLKEASLILKKLLQ